MSPPSTPPSASAARSSMAPGDEVELDSGVSGIDEITEGQILSEPPPPRLPIAGDSDVEESPLAREGEVLAQRYVIKRLIAKGGMGRVYLATQTPLGREVAVKCLIRQPNDKEFRKRFFLEASICARLTHRHIVTVHDYGEADNGELFMAMEYLRGDPLSRVVSREGRLSSDRIGRIALQIGRALRAAHRIGVVHRDLKPGNVMLLRDEDQDTADFIKVLDFGLVKAYQTGAAREPEGSDLTRAGTWLGSPRYMAPEQIRCRDVDPRTDIYSLGAVLFHALAGRPPFTGATSVEIFEQHLRDPVPWIREIGGPLDVAPELETVVRRCLEKEPDRRYQSMDELIADLKTSMRLMSGASILGESTAGHAAPDSSELGSLSRLGTRTPAPSGIKLDDLVADALSELGPAGSDSGKVEAAALSVPPLASTFSAPPPRVHVTQSQAAALSSLPPPRPRPVVPLVIGGVLVALAVVWWLIPRAPAPAAPPVERVEIPVTLVSQPSGAQVSLDGVVIGSTPFEYRVRDRAPGARLRFEFELGGYVRRTVEAELGRSPMSLTAALEAVTVAAPPSVTPAARAVASVPPSRRPSPRARTEPRVDPTVAAPSPSAADAPVGAAPEGRSLSVDDDRSDVPVVGGVPTVE